MGLRAKWTEWSERRKALVIGLSGVLLGCLACTIAGALLSALDTEPAVTATPSIARVSTEKQEPNATVEPTQEATMVEPTQEPSPTLEPTNTPTPVPMAWLSGIDCTEGSGAYGELVVPDINIWTRHGPDRGRVVGKLSHGTQVEVLERLYVEQESRHYYRVRSRSITGWVPETFVRDDEPGESGCP